MIVIVDIEGILPEGFVHPITGDPVLNMDVLPIFEFHGEAQLQQRRQLHTPPPHVQRR